MKFKISIFLLLLAACANPRHDLRKQVLTTIEDSINGNIELQVAYRKYLTYSYSNPILFDSTFTRDNKTYKVSFRHYSTNDSGLVIPARFNYDTREKFITSNFKSTLILIEDGDTLFSKEINKNMFGNLLDKQLDSFAILQYPDVKLLNDSIEVYYSISIPATDIGKGASIKFDRKGNATTFD